MHAATANRPAGTHSQQLTPCATADVANHAQAQKEVPADLAACKDKFLVQVKALTAGEVRQQPGSVCRLLCMLRRLQHHSACTDHGQAAHTWVERHATDNGSGKGVVYAAAIRRCCSAACVVLRARPIAGPDAGHLQGWRWRQGACHEQQHTASRVSGMHQTPALTADVLSWCAQA